MTTDSTAGSTVDPTRRFLLRTGSAFAVGAVWAVSMRTASSANPRVIEVVAKKFVFVPAEIRVKRGEAVTLRFTAPEVPMGFSLPDFGLRTDIVPGQVAALELTTGKAGSFAFLCDLFCGSGHEDMNGVLIVS